MLEFEQARQRILGAARPLPSESVPIEHAMGRVLREDLRSERPLPSEHTSAMDGYALALEDLPSVGPFELPVSGESRAGLPLPALEPGSACRIFTGAVLPDGADSVILQEDVLRSAQRIRFDERPSRGQHVRAAGSDLPSGVIALSLGTRISAFCLGVMAALDRREVQVSRRPRVTILCTGDELRAPGSAARAGSIPESNSIVLRALAERAGASVTLAPLVGDDVASTRSELERALQSSDLLLTVGGVSVGDHDVVQGALTSAGAHVDFWKVRIKPGKPLLLAQRGECTVLGLPGNPVSAQVTFCLFGLPLLRAMQGDARPLPEVSRGELLQPIRQKPGRLAFQRVRREGSKFTPLGNQSSGSTLSLAEADALALVPAEVSELPAGSEVELLWLDRL